MSLVNTTMFWSGIILLGYFYMAATNHLEVVSRKYSPTQHRDRGLLMSYCVGAIITTMIPTHSKMISAAVVVSIVIVLILSGMVRRRWEVVFDVMHTSGGGYLKKYGYEVFSNGMRLPDGIFVDKQQMISLFRGSTNFECATWGAILFTFFRLLSEVTKR